MNDLLIAQVNEDNLTELVESNRLKPGSHSDSQLMEKISEGMLCVARFGAGLDSELARRVMFYRVTDWGDGFIQLDPFTELNERLQLTIEDWKRLRIVPTGLRAIHTWSVTTRRDIDGLDELFSRDDLTREDLLERYFLLPVEDLDHAQDIVQSFDDLRPADRFVCYRIDDATLHVRVMESDDGENVLLLQETPGVVVAEYDIAREDVDAAARHGRGEIRQIWTLLQQAEPLAELPYDDIWHYHLLAFPTLVKRAQKTGPPWDGPMWQGLMEWVESDEEIAKDHLVSNFAARNILDVLSEEEIYNLTFDRFDEQVLHGGGVYDESGERVGVAGSTLDTVEKKLESGEWYVKGNTTVSSGGVNTIRAYRGPMAVDDYLKSLQDGLLDFLHGEGDGFERVERAKSEVRGLNDNMLTLILCMSEPKRYGIRNASSKRGAKRLAQLLGVADEWDREHFSGNYPDFNELLLRLLDESDGVFSDLLEVDAFLHRVDKFGEPRHWKVSVGIGDEEHEELIERAIAQNFAAVRGGEPDANDTAFREIKPGDYVVMHREQCIAAVGRVTRPYYEIDDTDADEIDRKWYRRIGVHWLPGQHDYRQALRGATRRRTVIDLNEGIFWWLAEKYSDDDRFEEVLNPPDDWRDRITPPNGEGTDRAWIFQANPERWDFDAMLRREVPFEENWTASRYRDNMRIGDTVYLWKSGPQAGIYAVGQIAREPYEFEASDEADYPSDWKVDLRVERVFSDGLVRDTLKEDPATADMEILNQPQATNFRLTPEENRRIRQLLGLLPPTIEDIAHACCCSVEYIEGIVTQLERKGQVIFFGPPGTGKTYVARQIAGYLAEGDESRRELIQFHPSYTYEDFMEGIKPESHRCDDDRWEVSYPVRAGSFKRFCERASDDPENTYVFVIDEINRGQIAKIFGELMYLLEYRDDKIELAYTKSETDDLARFGIPPNVRIIGTMNTADRSIALVDFALRRRFTFIPFYPDEGDVRQMLPTWLERHAPEMRWVASLVDELNVRLKEAMDRDYLIGHSYFMQRDLSETRLQEIWSYQIEPLLDEYFVGTPRRARDEFALDPLIRRARGEPEEEVAEE